MQGVQEKDYELRIKSVKELDDAIEDILGNHIKQRELGRIRALHEAAIECFIANREDKSSEIIKHQIRWYRLYGSFDLIENYRDE